jgi:hypothetical protein
LRLARVTAAALAVALLAAAPALAESWASPFRIAGPVASGMLPAQLEFAPGGGAAVGFTNQDEDNPATSQAFTVLRSARGQIGLAHRVGGAQEILDLGYDGKSLDLLTGSSPAGHACCSSVRLVPAAGRSQTVMSGLTGATMGRLVVMPGHAILAAVATARGVWAWQSGKGPARRLTSASATAQTLAAATLAGGRSALAWTATNGQAGAPNPRSIVVATGSAARMPRAPHVAVQAPPGHQIDELQMTGGTLAWVESWWDARWAYHSQVLADDLGRPAHSRSFAGGLAAGLTFAGDGRGDQLLAWKGCDSEGSCTVYAATRPAGGRFGAPQALGPIDASQTPAAAMRKGEGLVAWVQQGHVYAADGFLSFAAPLQVSDTNYAAQVTLAFAPNGAALAAWTQGTLNTSVMGAVHHG